MPLDSSLTQARRNRSGPHRVACARRAGIIGIVANDAPRGALLSALIPAVALVAGLPFANRLEPVVLGLPFLLFWIVGWVFVTPVFLGVAYVLAGGAARRAAGGAGR